MPDSARSSRPRHGPPLSLLYVGTALEFLALVVAVVALVAGARPLRGAGIVIFTTLLWSAVTLISVWAVWLTWTSRKKREPTETERQGP